MWERARCISGEWCFKQREQSDGKHWGTSGLGLSRNRMSGCVGQSQQNGEKMKSGRKRSPGCQGCGGIWVLALKRSEWHDDLCFRKISLDVMLIKGRRVKTRSQRPTIDSEKWFAQRCASTQWRCRARTGKQWLRAQTGRSACFCVTCKVTMVLTFWKVVKGRGTGGEATETVYGLQNLKYNLEKISQHLIQSIKLVVGPQQI